MITIAMLLLAIGKYAAEHGPASFAADCAVSTEKQ